MTVVITVTRDFDDAEVDILVNVIGMFCKGEPGTLNNPGERGYVEFVSAEANGKPFELTELEKTKALKIMLNELREELPKELRGLWNI
jgi:hypothetical protein